MIDLSDVSCSVDYLSTVTPFDIDQAVADLAELREIRQGLADWENELTAWLAEALGFNTLTLDDGKEVTVKRGNTRKAWDHDSLLRVVLARVPEMSGSSTPKTGRPKTLAEADAAGVDGLRPHRLLAEGALAKRGLDVDEFCETTAGRPRVVIAVSQRTST